MVKYLEPTYEILTDLERLNPLKMIELAARTCYQSFDYMEEGSELKLAEHLVERKHWAMIEHGGLISVRFRVNRGFTHEMVRHRLASFGQESSRYCNYIKGKFGKEISVIIPPQFESKQHQQSELYKFWLKAMEDAENHYFNMITNGATAQLARGVLPIDLKSEIIVSANLREWYHILSLRTHPAAHPIMQVIMRPLLKEFKQKIPVIFNDILNFGD